MIGNKRPQRIVYQAPEAMPLSLRLPASLREQIENEQGSNPLKRKRSAPTRKEARKRARQEQKQRKAQFFTQPKLSTSRLEPPREPHSDVPLKKLVRNNVQSTNVNAKKTSSIKTEKKSKPSTSNKIPAPDFEKDPEDMRISWLEAQLGVGPSIKKSRLFGDGLDDLMDDLDRIASRPMGSKSMDVDESTSLHRQDESSGSDEGSTKPSDEEEDGEDEDEDEDETQDNLSEFEGFSVDIYADLSTNAEMPADSRVETSVIPTPQTHYVPPHLRKAETNSEKLNKLVRQLKGLLNRLSESNLTSILNSIEELYREYARNDVTTSLTRLIIDSIALHSSHLDAFVVLHATLIGALYKIVGVDFAAHVIQTLNDTYHYYYLNQESPNNELKTETEIDESVPRGKECLNLVILFSELYNFQVVSCVLMYDIIRELLDKLEEMDVELLLKILRNSGQQLRQDDPSALKDIVDTVHSKVTEKDKSTICSRTQFMVETLTNLKNNKVKRSANPDVHIEQVERMKKFLTGLNKKHHVKAHEPLRVTLSDLRSAEKRGKWWLVGAAWNGNPLVEKANEFQLALRQDQSDDSLLKLARKQGMNTDVRRSIFVVLMSSDDYIDACERLSQLNLSEVQQREIIRVVLHCLGNEKQYNPYYTLVLQHLSQNSHSNKITLQYCFWDFLRQMGEKEVGGAEILKNVQNDEPDFDVGKQSTSKHSHFARAFAWLIAKDGSSLLIFKPVDFTRLRPPTKAFMRNLFSHIFISSQVSSPAITLDQTAARYLTGSERKQDVLEQVFIKAVRVPALTQGLIFFIRNVLDDVKEGNKVILEVLQWGRDVALNTLRGTADIGTDL